MTIYTATFSAVDVAAAQDLFAIVASSTGPVKILNCFLGQYSDWGDAAAEILPITVKRGATAAGSGGGAVTPVDIDANSGSTASSTVRRNDTTPAGTGTIVTLVSGVMNVAAGWSMRDVLDAPIILAPGQRLVFHTVATPTDALTMNGTLVFEERGW